MNAIALPPMNSATDTITHASQSGTATGITCSSPSFVNSNVNALTGAEAVSPYRSLWLDTMARLSSQASISTRLLPRDLPAEHASYLSKNGRFKIQAKAWILLHSGQPIVECRMVLIEGSANTILNTWAFPFASSQLPVFAAELIAMAGLPRLTFMDIQVPGLDQPQRQKSRRLTDVIRSSYCDLVSDELPPSWAIDSSDGNYLFMRGAEADAFPRIQSAYLELLDAYLTITRACEASCHDRLCNQQATESLRDYQHHHMQHSPGRMFLGKVFGEQWTDDFLTHFLFTLPGA